ncbi:hypothetical protein [Pseudomonas phage D6]|nr:hypothetical protein [Pseudomonas phage D6]
MANKNELDLFIDYITNPTHIWDPTKYKKDERVFYVTQHEGTIVNFRYTYILGTAYMVGEYGKDEDTVEVFYRDLQGFQVVTSVDGREISRASFPPHGIEQVKQHINRLVDLG